MGVSQYAPTALTDSPTLGERPKKGSTVKLGE